MNSFLRQSTASQARALGPFISSTDFIAPMTGLTIANTDIKIVMNGAASANKASGGGTHRINGVYGVTFDATDTATVGEMFVSVVVATALPVFHTFQVLEEAVFDALFAASAPGYLQPTVAARTLDVSVAGEAGIDWANIGSPGTTQTMGATTIGNVSTVGTVNLLANNAITSGVIASGAIAAGKFAAGAIDAAAIANGAIDAATFATGAIDAAAIATGAITSAKFAAGAINAAAVATDAIDADAIAASAVTEIQAGLATSAAISGLNNLSQAQAQTAAAAALTAYDPPTHAEMTAELATTDDATLAAIAGLNNLSAAGAQAASTAALTAYDPPTHAEMTSALNALPAAPSAVANADALLSRDLGGAGVGVLNERTVRSALRMMRNRWSISAGVMSVFKEDDATAAWTANVTASPGDPVSQVDPQ